MRIVSLLPSATEILFGIGAGNEVVGVTHECDYPAEAPALPKLTSASGPEFDSPREIDRHVRAAVHAGSSLYRLDAELLETLQPDLIVTQELCAVCAVSYDVVATAAKRLRSDARVVSLEPASLHDVFATIEFLGDVTKHGEQARELVESLTARIRAVSTLRHAQGDTARGDTVRGDTVRGDTRRMRTLVLEWTDPPMSAGHWIPELIEIAGGTPILANAGANSQRLEWDAIAAADPDAVIVAPCGFDLSKSRRATDELDAIEPWRSLRARRAGRVLAMDGNAHLSRPGPRLVDATEMIAQWYTT
ncbi:MAG TPA: ABC transporter substrate-binding protein, partial [Candidatus Cybelea sp.]